jgi:hypothetical protein
LLLAEGGETALHLVEAVHTIFELLRYREPCRLWLLALAVAAEGYRLLRAVIRGLLGKLATDFRAELLFPGLARADSLEEFLVQLSL